MDVDGLVVRVRHRWLVALCLLAVLALAAFGGMRATVAAQEGSAAQVNVAGRQRMLSQRIAMLGGRVADARASSVAGGRRDDLAAAVDLFDASHAALRDGDDERGLPGRPSAAIVALRAGQEGLDVQVERYVDVARRLAASRDAAELASLAVSLDAIASETGPESLLGRLDRAVSTYEGEAEAAVARAQLGSTIVLALTLGALALVARRVFVPMESQLRRTIELDLTLRSRYETRLRHQVDHDGLTGLWSRDRLLREVRRATTQPGRGVAVLFCDIDDFKDVNDRLGHEAGDAVLERVGQRLASALRADDGAARLGGDEFAVLLVDVDEAEARGAARRIADELSQPVELAAGWYPIEVSVGFSHRTRPDRREDLLGQADVAMSAARQRSSHVAAYTTELGRARAEEVALRADLARVLRDHDGLWLAFQPLVDNRDLSIVGFEALLRWEHPERGFVAPDTFIPQAEASGQMVQLGGWVVDRAIAAQRRFAAATEGAGRSPRVWINVSATQLRAPGLADVVLRALERHGASGSDVVVELTESVAAEDLEVVRRELGGLRAVGVQVAMDDFGTGYSSLSHLRDLPLDLLKVDRALVMADDASAVPVLRAVVALADELGLAVVAEGIEDDEVQRRVTELGIAIGQGWHHGRPAPVHDAVALLTAGSDGPDLLGRAAA